MTKCAQAPWDRTPACPDNHKTLVDGTRAARQILFAVLLIPLPTLRLMFRKTPKLTTVQQGEDREARWRRDLKLDRQMPSTPLTATPAHATRSRRTGRRYAPKTWELRAGHFQSELRIGFQLDRTPASGDGRCRGVRNECGRISTF